MVTGAIRYEVPSIVAEYRAAERQRFVGRIQLRPRDEPCAG